MHELRGIERMPPSWHGYLLLMSLLIAVVLALFVWYVSRKHKKKSTHVGQIKTPTHKRRVHAQKRK